MDLNLATMATIQDASEAAQAVGGAASIALTLGQMGDERQAAKSDLKTLDLQSQQSQIQYMQKMLGNDDLMQKVMDKQLVQASARGLNLSSPSFNAIQRATYNTGAKQAQNIQSEENISQMNIQVEKANTKRR